MITTKMPQVDPNGRYNITQAASLLGVSRSTALRYVDNGTLKVRVRKSDNRKITTGRWIIECWEDTYL